MKARDRSRMSVLRTALAAIANAAAPRVETRAWPLQAAGSTEVERLALTDADRQRIITTEIGDREDTIAEFERNGRTAEAAILRDEVAVLREYQE
jgi:uncharacterized protein YqeY